MHRRQRSEESCLRCICNNSVVGLIEHRYSMSNIAERELAGAIHQTAEEQHESSRRGKEMSTKQEEIAAGARKLYSQQSKPEAELRRQSSRQSPIQQEIDAAYHHYPEHQEKMSPGDMGGDQRQLASRLRKAKGEMSIDETVEHRPRLERLDTVSQMTEDDRKRHVLLGRRNSDTTRTLTAHPTIRTPPKFNAEFYQRWKGEVGHRRGIHIFDEDSASISDLALDSADILRTVLIESLKDTRLLSGKRKFGELHRIADREFQRYSPERAMGRLNAFNSFVRGSIEEVRHFLDSPPKDDRRRHFLWFWDYRENGVRPSTAGAQFKRTSKIIRPRGFEPCAESIQSETAQ